MDFLLAVLSLPGVFPGEADCLEGLLAAGLQRLHLRKPGAAPGELEMLVARLAPRYGERLVLHGGQAGELALRYGVRQVHGSVAYRDGSGFSGGGPRVDGLAVGAADGQLGDGLAVSTSVHSWEEFGKLPGGLAYAFISPVFDSISKQGYGANTGLLQRPERLPCPAMGLGGVSGETIGVLMEYGWAAAAVLGWIWKEPGKAVQRFGELQKMIDDGKK